MYLVSAKLKSFHRKLLALSAAALAGLMQMSWVMIKKQCRVIRRLHIAEKL